MRHDFAALARCARVGPSAKVVPCYMWMMENGQLDSGILFEQFSTENTFMQHGGG